MYFYLRTSVRNIPIIDASGLLYSAQSLLLPRHHPECDDFCKEDLDGLEDLLKCLVRRVDNLVN